MSRRKMKRDNKEEKKSRGDSIKSKHNQLTIETCSGAHFSVYKNHKNTKMRKRSLCPRNFVIL